MNKNCNKIVRNLKIVNRVDFNHISLIIERKEEEEYNRKEEREKEEMEKEEIEKKRTT